MSAVVLSVLGVLAGAVGMLVTLFVWARERVTLRHAEEATRENTKSFLPQDIDIDLIRGPQEDIDARQAVAVSELLRALAHTNNAVVQVGTILVVKVDGRVLVQELPTKGLRYLERHPELKRNPEAMLTALNDPSAPFSSSSATPKSGAD
jgi:hypothetical protein